MELKDSVASSVLNGNDDPMCMTVDEVIRGLGKLRGDCIHSSKGQIGDMSNSAQQKGRPRLGRPTENRRRTQEKDAEY